MVEEEWKRTSLKKDINFDEADEKDARELLKSHTEKLIATLVEKDIILWRNGYDHNFKRHTVEPQVPYTLKECMGHANVMLNIVLKCTG